MRPVIAMGLPLRSWPWEGVCHGAWLQRIGLAAPPDRQLRTVFVQCTPRRKEVLAEPLVTDAGARSHHAELLTSSPSAAPARRTRTTSSVHRSTRTVIDSSLSTARPGCRSVRGAARAVVRASTGSSAVASGGTRRLDRNRPPVESRCGSAGASGVSAPYRWCHSVLRPRVRR